MSDESRRARAIALHGTSDPLELARKEADLRARHQAGLAALQARQKVRLEAALQQIWAQLGVRLKADGPSGL